MNYLRRSHLTSLLVLLTIGLQGQLNFDSEIDALLAKMTLEEKVGQMNQYNGFYDATGPAPEGGNAALKYEHLKKGWVGSMLNVHGVEEVRKIQELAVNESRLGIPLIFGFDVIHGYKTLSPIPLAEAASWDLDAIKNSASIAATEAAAVGLNWAFAPMIDISRDARWGRVMEGGGEDPYLGSKIAIARINGFQGDDLSLNNTVAATAKHFAAYGFVEAGKEYNTTDIGTNTLYNFVLPPFEAAVSANVSSVMNGFNLLNGVPVTASSFLQRDILKGKWNFNGFVISDWSSIGELVPHGYAKDLKEAAELGAIAGSDMDMESKAYINHLTNLVNEGKVPIAVIDEAVRRILRVKFELGLFADPYRYCNVEREKEMLYNEKHQKGVLDMAKKSIVLLKNENKLLPLKKDQKDILVIGDLADDKNSPLGSWRLASDNNTAVSVLEGLNSYTKDYRYVQGPKYFDDDTDFLYHVKINKDNRSGMEEAIDAAKTAKTVVLVVGEHGYMSGEGRSRTSLGLPGLQHELIQKIYDVNKNIILVMMNGRPLTISWEAENLPTIVEAWQLGSQTGNAIAQVLFGDHNPSGKLPMTFPRSTGQVPIYYNHYSTARANEEPIVFWTHYADEKNDPQFPFGFGLSYSTFEYTNLKIDSSNPKNIIASVTVTNTSAVAGEEVVQLYINDPASRIVRPVKELKGFEKISLAAKQSTTISFSLTDKELGYYNQDYKWVVEPGSFNIMIGTNSQEGLTGSFELK